MTDRQFSCCGPIIYPEKLSAFASTGNPTGCFYAAFGLFWNGSRWEGASPNGGQITGNAALEIGRAHV